jgi:hypothetical protein
MNAHEGFEEIPVGQLARFGVELAHGERLLEGVFDFASRDRPVNGTFQSMELSGLCFS